MHRFANPTRFHRFSQRVQPGLSWATLLSLGIGLWLALLQSPPDYQQGEAVRIMFVHVPSAWIAMTGYMLLAALGASLLVWRHPLAALMARGAAPVGAVFCAVCLAHRLAMGPADVGHLLGVGRPPYLDAALVLPLSRPHCAEPRLRRSRPRRQGRRDSGAGRRDQCAGHQILGRLVEHAAPACLGDEARRAVDPSLDPDAAPGDGAGAPLLFVVLVLLRTDTEIDRRRLELAQDATGALA